MYIVNKKVNFSFLILTNSLKDSYGAEYILPDEIIELKRIMSDENLNRFNLSQNTIENDFLFQRFVEFLYPYKYDNSLENFYKTQFALIHHHKYSLTELENMLPWEREIYINQLVQYLKEENERRRERSMKK